MDKINKLSDAVRLGATFRPQAFGSAAGKNLKESCALVAAAEAVTGVHRHGTISAVDDLLPRFPELTLRMEHPVRHFIWELRDIIPSLNDYARWPREKIADWLESIGL